MSCYEATKPQFDSSTIVNCSSSKIFNLQFSYNLSSSQYYFYLTFYYKISRLFNWETCWNYGSISKYLFDNFFSFYWSSLKLLLFGYWHPQPIFYFYSFSLLVSQSLLCSAYFLRGFFNFIIYPFWKVIHFFALVFLIPKSCFCFLSHLLVFFSEYNISCLPRFINESVLSLSFLLQSLS